MKVHSYDNPTNRCPVCHENPTFPIGCCDQFGSLGDCNGLAKCDNAFFYCLRELNTPPDDNPNAPKLCGFNNVGGVISRVNTDAAELDYSQRNVLGLSNPIRLTGITAKWKVLLWTVLKPGDNSEMRQLDMLLDTFTMLKAWMEFSHPSPFPLIRMESTGMKKL